MQLGDLFSKTADPLPACPLLPALPASPLPLPFPSPQGNASPHMLAVMAQSADRLFATVNAQLLRIFEAAEAAAAGGGEGPPPSRGAKYALNVMLQGMSVPQIATGLTQVGVRAWLGEGGVLV